MKRNNWKKHSFFIMLFTLFFISGVCKIYSQEEEYRDIYSSRKTYLYKSIDEMKSDKGEYVGIITKLSTNRLSHPIINSRIDSKHFKKNVQRYWGFKIGDDIFRMKQGGFGLIPVKLIGEKEKVFYIDGISLIKNKTRGDNSGNLHFFTKKNLYYSDTKNSKIKYINTLKNIDSYSKELSDLCDCINEKKKIGNDQDRLDNKFNCIKDYLMYEE